MCNTCSRPTPASVGAGAAGAGAAGGKGMGQDMFARLAGEDNEIDSEELQDLLTATFMKGKDLPVKCVP